jgi:hypothetical protein
MHAEFERFSGSQEPSEAVVSSRESFSWVSKPSRENVWARPRRRV